MSSSFTSILGLRRLSAVALALAAVAAVSPAASLSFDVTMYIQPNENAPVAGILTAGTSIKSLLRDELTAAGLDSPPSGWIAIRHSGPFTGFVENRSVQKDGTINTGAQIHTQPLADAPLLLVVEAGDRAVAREPVGDWSRATIRTDLVVFVNALPPASQRQEPDFTPLPVAPEPYVSAPPADAELSVQGKRAKPAQTLPPPKETKVEPAPVETNGAPRVFEGYLLRTRRFLGRGPKFAYQLVDENNQRIALLDVSSLMATSPLTSFEDRLVTVYGPAVTRPDVKDLIIRVQTLRLLR